MQATQIYLTDEQERAIARRSADARISRSEVIRRILNAGLGIDDESADRLAAIDATAGIMPDAPDWPEWLAAVRGRGNDGRGRSALIDQTGAECNRGRTLCRPRWFEGV